MNAVDWQGRHQSGGCIEREAQGPGATPTPGSLPESTGLDVRNGGVRTGPIVQNRSPRLCEIEIQPRLGPGRVALRGPSLGRYLSRAHGPVLGDPEEGVPPALSPALVLDAPGRARSAPPPTDSAPSTGPRGPGRTAPPPLAFRF